MLQKSQNNQIQAKMPLFQSSVAAGFPSPADDFIDKRLDLNELLIKHPAATFFVRVDGNSMIRAGIRTGDILVVDKSLEPKEQSIVIASIDGEFTVKRIQKKSDDLYLIPENPRFTPTKITKTMDFEVWGVVSHIIHPANL